MPLLSKQPGSIRTFFAIRHEIAAEGVHVDTAVAGTEERMFAFAELLLVDREPQGMGIRKRSGLIPAEQRLLEDRTAYEPHRRPPVATLSVVARQRRSVQTRIPGAAIFSWDDGEVCGAERLPFPCGRRWIARAARDG